MSNNHDGSNLTSHHSSCHCGAVQFDFLAPAQMSMTICNCSICAMTGYEHIFVPKGQVSLTGEENLTQYFFGSRTARHLFCKTCGIKPLYSPRSHPQNYSINRRCVTPGTLQISEVIKFDGQNWEENIAALHGKS